MERTIENATMTVDRVVLSRLVSAVFSAMEKYQMEKYQEVAHDMYFRDYADAEIHLAELGKILLKFQDMGILTPTFWEDYESEEDQEDEILEFMGVM